MEREKIIPTPSGFTSTTISVTAFATFVVVYHLLGGTMNRKIRRLLFWMVNNFGKPPKDVERLSSRVVRIVGQNPGIFTLQGTNTYVVGKGENRILIDASDGNPTYIDILKKYIAAENIQITHLILSHHHFDHVGGVPEVRQMFPGAKICKFKMNSNEKDVQGLDYNDLRDGDTIKEGDTTIRIVHTPGHCKDHIVLVLEEESAIFTADCILGSGSCVFESLYEYMKSLNLIKEIIKSFDESKAHAKDRYRMYPGHGIVIEDGLAKVNDYIHHREEREAQVLEYLSNKKWSSVPTMVDTIYEDQHLSWITKMGAKRAIVNHLKKLEREGKVVQNRANQWKLEE